MLLERFEQIARIIVWLPSETKYREYPTAIEFRMNEFVSIFVEEEKIYQKHRYEQQLAPSLGLSGNSFDFIYSIPLKIKHQKIGLEYINEWKLTEWRSTMMHYMERLIGLNRDRTLRQSTFECRTQTDGYGQLQLRMIALCPLDHWMNRKKNIFFSMIETVTLFITNRSKLCHIDCVSFYQQDCSVCVHGSNVVYIYCHCHIWIWTNKKWKKTTWFEQEISLAANCIRTWQSNISTCHSDSVWMQVSKRHHSHSMPYMYRTAWNILQNGMLSFIPPQPVPPPPFPRNQSKPILLLGQYDSAVHRFRFRHIAQMINSIRMIRVRLFLQWNSYRGPACVCRL